MRQIKISIRTQLLILVLSTALFSLLVLAIVTGVYFTHNLISSSLEKLQVISQLKSSQLEQTYNYNYYQLYSLSSREDIKNALTNYKAGNTSSDVYLTGQDLLQQYIDSTENFYEAALYSVNGERLFAVENSVVPPYLTNFTSSFLMPISKKSSTPLQLKTNNVLFEGPVLNDTTYLFSLTLPVYANSSILISTPDLAGYMTVVVNAAAISLITTDNNALRNSRVNMLKGVTSKDNATNYIGFTYAFEPSDYVNTNINYKPQIYDFSVFPLLKDILQNQILSGKETKIKTPMNNTVAMGYALVAIAGDYWIVCVEQGRGDFLAASNRLAKIISGIVVGLAVMVCLITFPLAHYGVRPIMKLQKATEELTYGREWGIYETNTNTKRRRSKDSGFFLKHLYRSRGGSNFSISEEKSSPHGDSDGGGGGGGGGGGTKVYPTNSNRTSLENNSSHSANLSNNTGNGGKEHFTIPRRITLTKRMITDELSELTELFNAMTDELDRQYTHLEDRVQERTRELEKLKIRAESADEAKTVFISQISHELRTPLNGILGLCSVCILEDDPTQVKESLKLIFRSGELLLHILTELLTFSKNTLKKSKLENKEFKMLEISWQIKSIFGKLAFDQNVDLTILIKPNFVRKMILFGDSNRIIQVLMNLVSNSLKFTPIDGKVDVLIRCLGEYDEERSKAIDYKKVLVKNSPLTVEEIKNTNEDNSNIVTSYGLRKSFTLKSYDDNDEDQNGDLQSIHTISTSEYNNVVFESQFKRKSAHDHSPTSTTDVGSQSSSMNEKITIIDDKFSASDDTDVQYDTAGGSGDGLYDDEDSSDIKHYKVRPLEEIKKWVMEFVVQDTGPGIEPALKDKVFEPFIQGDQTLSRSHGGTGLGLSICRQLATMMNGTLELEEGKAGNAGKGSRFIFRIPLPQVKELVITSKQDEEDLYNDEFNPDSKKNRKVKIVEPGEHDIPMSIKRSSSTNNGESTDYDQLSKHRMIGNSNLLKLEIPTSSSSAPISLQLLSAAAQSPSASIQSSSYFVDKPSLLTKSSTGTAHSLPSSSANSCGTSCGGSITPKSKLLNNFKTMSSPKEEDDRSQTTSPGRPSLKFLVAEDNQVNQEVIKRMLMLEGFTNIKLACDGQELIDFLSLELEKDEFYDIIFMDVQMPKLDGVSATKHIRNELHYDKPIVALTAYADESNVTKCLESGMSGFLAKPIRRAQLRKIINEFGYGSSTNKDDNSD